VLSEGRIDHVRASQLLAQCAGTENEFAWRLVEFANGPGAAMDAFSEILNGIKLNGALSFNAGFSAPLGFAARGSRIMAPALASGTPHLVIDHFVKRTSGSNC
jgi:hypothetical protein